MKNSAWLCRDPVSLLFGLAAGLSLATAGERLQSADPAQEPARSSGAAVEIDRDRGEVRVPCWFVNASRKLEVFACQESGPTHETVVAFGAEGKAIYDVLRDLGFRGPEFWNATSPGDLRLTGGDRALVWVRWGAPGKGREFLAEEILVEESTALPLFTRGFSFAAEPIPLGDPPQRRIPSVVELTIGGTARQSASFSLLYHPNDLQEMVHWAPAPEVSARAVPDLSALVEERVPCTLVIRRLRSEADLIELARERESDPARRRVREAQRPAAQAIDKEKREFETLVGDIQKVLMDGESRKDLSDADRRQFAARLQDLLARGARLAAEIRAAYLDLWGIEEEHRFAALKDAAHLDASQRAWVGMAYRSGFRFERAMAKKRLDALALAEGTRGAPADPDGLLQKALQAEIEALDAERERRWAGFRLEDQVRPRLKDLDPKEEAYTFQIFQEDEKRILADMRALRARVEGSNIDSAELKARASGALARREEEFLRLRARVQAAVRLAQAERESVDVLEKLRWARNPPGGAPSDADREEEKRLEKESLAAREHVSERRKALEALLGRPAGLGDEPPEDGEGQPLFREGSP